MTDQSGWIVRKFSHAEVIAALRASGERDRRFFRPGGRLMPGPVDMSGILDSMDYEESHGDSVAHATISQRGRGLYLANVGWSSTGDETWEAFSSLAKAKRWCAGQLGHSRLPWEDMTKPDQWQRYYAEVPE